MPAVELQLPGTEQKLVDLVKGIFGGKLRMVEGAPAEWTVDFLKRAIVSAPAVFVSFLGGPDPSPGGTEAKINGTWAFSAVTAHASGAEARRIGDAVQIGAYEIVELLARRLHRQVIEGIGSLTFVRIDNLFTDQTDKLGLAAYSVYFNLPMNFPGNVNLDVLKAFLTFKGEIDMAAKDGQTDAKVTVTLPQ